MVGDMGQRTIIYVRAHAQTMTRKTLAVFWKIEVTKICL